MSLNLKLIFHPNVKYFWCTYSMHSRHLHVHVHVHGHGRAWTHYILFFLWMSDNFTTGQVGHATYYCTHAPPSHTIVIHIKVKCSWIKLAKTQQECTFKQLQKAQAMKGNWTVDWFGVGGGGRMAALSTNNTNHCFKVLILNWRIFFIVILIDYILQVHVDY